MNTLKYNDSKLKMFLQTLIFKPIGYFKKAPHTDSYMKPENSDRTALTPNSSVKPSSLKTSSQKQTSVG